MTSREPESVELVRGVAWTLRPRTGLVQSIVEAKVQSAMRRLRAGADVLEEYGLEGSAIEMADPEVAMGFAMLITACHYADQLLQAWEGVEGADGQPAEINAENIRQALNYGPTPEAGPILLTPFWNWLNAPAARRADEGKSSAPSLNTSTAGARKHVEDAPLSAPPAPTAEKSTASAAPKSKTPRKPRKASSPG